MTVLVNGKKVYSDKTVKSIVRTRITYTDGSWCDVETGEAVNKGPGTIVIDVPIGKDDKNKIIEKSFMTNILKLTTLFADVNIQVGNHPQIKIKVEGPDSIIKNIDISENENILCIRGKSGVDSRRVSIQIDGGCNSIFNIEKQVGMNIRSFGGKGSVYVDNGNVIIGEITDNNISIGLGEGNEVKITVSVPKGTQIDVSDVSGKVNIGDTEGKLQANVRGASSICAGRIKDAVLNVNGSGDIRVQEVSGSLTAQIAGSGSIRIKQGNVTTLNAAIVGSGDIIFGGRAEDAILTITGSGNIKGTYIKNRPVTNIVGSGDIDIGS